MRRSIIVELADRVRRMTPPGLGEISAHAHRRAGARRSILRLDAEDLGWAPPPLAWLGSGGEGEIRRWMADRLGCVGSSSDEVLLLRGPLAPHHLIALAFLNPGESVLMPDPGPPIFRTAALLAGAHPVGFPGDSAASGAGAGSARARGRGAGGPARGAASFVGARSSARLQFLAPLAAPTGCADPPGFLDDVVRAALLDSRILVEDVSGLLLDLGLLTDDQGAPAPHPTLLAHPRGPGAGIEIVTFDALFGAGRSPFSIVYGNRDLVAGVRRVASSLGLPVGAPAGRAIAQFLSAVDDAVARARPRLFARREELAAGLCDLGLLGTSGWPVAGFTLWARLPSAYRSLRFTRILFRRAGVLVRPGTDFGESGEGRIAISYALSKKALARALDRLDKRAPRKLVFERRFWSAMREIAERIRSR